eukprot:TRINITY_DN10266_c1_g2_i1.p1 TRINITY_DN10266_c1_g2~~TRINITY_DN10266_c1_g2_i1.p1  ORF type:complete len:821 (+),score=134.95 TRINITY_DN10266_c1_g2_i1:276-2738(+)
MGNRCGEIVQGNEADEDDAVSQEKSEAALTKLVALNHSEDEDDEDSDGTGSGSSNQDHVFAYAARLQEVEAEDLEDQFESVFDGNPKAWKHRFKQAKASAATKEVTTLRWLPPDHVDWSIKRMPRIPAGASYTEENTVPEWMRANWRNDGREVVGNNKVALIILAADTQDGVGYRSNDHPLGVMDIGLLSRKSLFQVYFERVRRLEYIINREKKLLREWMESAEMMRKMKKKARISQMCMVKTVCSIPVYVMVSASNEDLVRDFLSANNYFGLSSTHVSLFREVELPVFDLKGKVMMASQGVIHTIPGGSGSLYSAVQRDGVLADARQRGIEQFFIVSMDNLLAKVVDPVLIGFQRSVRAAAVAKIVVKTDGDEKMGVLVRSSWERKQPAILKSKALTGSALFASLNQPPGPQFLARILDYSQMPSEFRKMHNDKKSLMYWHGDTGQLVLTRDFFELCCRKSRQSEPPKNGTGPTPLVAKRSNEGSNLRFHWRPVALSFSDWRHGGQLRDAPATHNGARLVSFVGDALEEAFGVCGLLVPREREYARVSTDDTTQAVSALSRLHQSWIVSAAMTEVVFGESGQKLMADSDSSLLCEISPLVSYGGEDLSSQLPQGFAIHLPLYLVSHDEIEIDQFVELRLSGSLHYVSDSSEVSQLESRWMREFTNRGRLDGIGESGGIEEVEDSEKLPGTPRSNEDVSQSFGALTAKVEDVEDIDQKSPEVLNALACIKRFPRLDVIDAQDVQPVESSDEEGRNSGGGNSQRVATEPGSPVSREAHDNRHPESERDSSPRSARSGRSEAGKSSQPSQAGGSSRAAPVVR